METFLVERNLKGISMAELGAAQKAAIGTAQELTRTGTPVTYLRSSFVPDTGECRCLFSAESAEAVKSLNERAQLPYDRIVKALDLSP